MIMLSRSITFMTLILPLVASCQPNNSLDKTMSKSNCEEVLLPYVENAVNSRSSEILKLKNACSKYQVYYYALTGAYYFEKNYIHAYNSASLGLKLISDYNASLYYLAFNSKVALMDFTSAKLLADEAKQKLPESDIGYLLLGRIYLLENKYDDSIVNLKKVFSENSLFEAKQNLTIAYYNTNQFDEAVSSFESGINANQVVYQDSQAVLAASASYYEIGNKQAARDVLDRHIALVPKSSSHPLVIKMYEILDQP